MTESNEVPFLVLEEQDQPTLRVGPEIEVYAFDDPSRLIGHVPERLSVMSLDEIRGAGGGAFSLWQHDPKLTELPDLLNWRNVVKVRLNHQVIGAFLVQNKEAEIISREEASGEAWKITGEGLRTWFRDAVVLPYGGVREKAVGGRVFSFASEQGAWYNASQWITPIKIQQHNLDPNDGPWNTAPAEWPDAPDAWWVWGVANDRLNWAPGGYNFFRYEFDIAEEVGTKNYSVFAAADGEFVGYVDAQEILSAEGQESWSRTWRADFELSPGHHVLAFRVLNASGVAGLISALFRAGDAAVGTAAELLAVTGDDGWAVNPYPDPAPGWSPGEIVLTLLAEAEARGVVFPTFLTPTFTATHDSRGVEWPRPLDWEFSLGTEYYEVLERLEEAVCDVWINPENLDLNMYVERGVDRTLQTAAGAPVTLTPGHNVLRASEDGTSDIKNTLLLETQDGWQLQGDAQSDSISVYGRIEGTLSTGMSKSLSADIAEKVFDLKAVPSVGVTYEITDVDAVRPFIDMAPGDWVLAPSSNGEFVPVRLMSVSVTEEAKNGQPKYAVEFGSRTEDLQDRHDRWLKVIANSVMGGQFSNVSSVGGVRSLSGTSRRVNSSGPQGLPGSPGASIIWEGGWEPEIVYSPRDLVRYDDQSWMALQESTGVPPAEGPYWSLAAAKGAPGEPGPPGAGVLYRGAWDIATTYAVGDLVQHGGSTWIASAPSTGAEPGTDPEWDAFLTGGSVAQTTTITAASGDGTVVLASAATIRQVAYSGAGRFRLYRTAAGRTADQGRAFTTAYAGGAGLLYDYLATGAQTDLERPVGVAWAAGETTYYWRADGGPVDVTLTWVEEG